MPDVTLRPTRPDEAAALTRLMVRAKASHGYDAETMAAFAPALVVTDAHLARNWLVVAERGETPIGFAHVEVCDGADGVAWLEDLFVDPDAQGQGIGRLLWDAVVHHARSIGATEIRFDADPNAIGFYERVGATIIGSTASTLIPGRAMPLMRVALPAATRR